MTTTEGGQLSARVHELASPIAAELDVEVLDVVVTGPRGRRVVRVVADATSLDPVAGVDIDTIAALSQRLGRMLDDEDAIAGAYTLEVTSPGVDRPLTRPRDFARNTGRTVRLVRTGDEGAAPLTGTVVQVDAAAVTLDIDGAEVEVPLADLDHGRVVLPW